MSFDNKTPNGQTLPLPIPTKKGLFNGTESLKKYFIIFRQNFEIPAIVRCVFLVTKHGDYSELYICTVVNHVLD